MASSPHLVQAATQFLASLALEKRLQAQAEVHRFVQWCGQDRPVASLTHLEVANYAESRAGAVDAVQRLEPVRSFLQFLRREGLTPSSLAPHLRLRKVTAKVNRGPLPQAATDLTPGERTQVERELVALRAKRPQLAEEIKRAAADKDFRENAPLEAAREELGQLESHIRELEALLRGGTISTSLPAEKAAIGSEVRLRDLATGEEEDYVLVGPRETDPRRGRISASSPVGQAVVGHGSGDDVEVVTPAGRFRYRILSVGHQG